MSTIAATDVGVIVNPHTRLIRRNPATVDGLRELLPASCPIVTTERADDAVDAVREFLEQDVRIIVTAGGDGTLASTISAWLRTGGRTPGGTPPVFLTLCAGSWNRVARTLGIQGSPQRILSRALRAIRRQRLNIVEQPTLRISSTLRPGPDFGFTAFFGSLYELVEDAQRRGAKRRDAFRAALSATREILRPREEASPTLVANVEGVATVIGMAHATTLNSASPQPAGRFAFGTGTGELLGELRRVLGVVLPGLEGGPPRQIHDVTFDLESGYVLDGDLHPANTPYTVRVELGPVVSLLVV